MTCAPRASRSCCVCVLTVAAVPTGMNAGVSMTPCGVVRRPRRAPVGSVARTSKRKPIRGSVSGERGRESHPHHNIEGPNGEDGAECFSKRNFLRVRRAVSEGLKDKHPEGEDIERGEQ